MHRPARIIDRCIYNYQREHSKTQCGPGFTCDDIVAIHKGHREDKWVKNHRKINESEFEAKFVADAAMCAKPKPKPYPGPRGGAAAEAA